MSKQLIVVAAVMVLCAGAHAQDGCGTRLTPTDAIIVDMLTRAGVYEWEGGVAQTYTVPLAIHVVRTSDRLGGLTQGEIDTAIANANVVWTPHEIEFCQFGQIRYIDSDEYFGVNSLVELNALRSIDVIPNTINVYLVNNISGDGESFCGWSSFSWSDVQGIVVANACMRDSNPSTLAHELGHYLDLLHTHETATDEECADGRNCDEAGDLLCDTPADPQLNLEDMMDGCDYVGDVDGPCLFDDPYDPDPTNVMSYAPKRCRTNLTAGQEGRALATLTNLRQELLVYGDCDFGGICGPGTGNCFTTNGSAGCNYTDCCAIVCAFDIYCCDTDWDDLCATAALERCGGCGTDAAGNCYLDNGTPGCRNEDCCELVCALSPYCCGFDWDDACAELALELCSGCGTPSGGACDEVHPWPGCADDDCCASVCAIEPTCCDMQWDPICVGLAIDLGCGAAGPGNECATAIPIGEGSFFVTLSDNTGATGDDSSCAAGDPVDEWYAYTPSCSGPVRISLCTEFTAVDIVLSVFDDCPGAEMACSANPIECSFEDSAELDVYVAAGVTYYVRVSAVGATPAMNFQGALEIQCRTGCGNSGTGDCFSHPSVPFCEDTECCLAVCAVDPFCCDNFWDAGCASRASEVCGGCGDPTAGDCLGFNLTPGCDQSDCCSTVCAEDPYCCAVAWDDLCVERAEDECAASAFGRFHLPLGAATLSVVPSGVLVSNVGASGEDGVEISLSRDHGGIMTVAYGGAWAGGDGLSLTALGPQPEPPDYPPLARIIAYHSGQQILLYGDFPDLGPLTYRLRVYNGDELVSEQVNVEGIAASPALPPDGLGVMVIGERDVATIATWDSPTEVVVYGGAVYPVTRLTITSEVGAAPDDPVGQPADRSVDQVRILGTGPNQFTITDEFVRGCPADVNGDGLVDVDDLIATILGWATASAAADVDDSGLVDVDDLVAVLLAWGPCS